MLNRGEMMAKGWKLEPINHALAGKGIKMGRSRVRK
jgi:hypothetical protein